MACIYCIKNDINDKVYIGKTVYTVQHRFKEHIRDAHNHKCNSKLHKAILKYGDEHFYPLLSSYYSIYLMNQLNYIHLL